jgi:hypothetical protein
MTHQEFMLRLVTFAVVQTASPPGRFERCARLILLHGQPRADERPVPSGWRGRSLDEPVDLSA